MKAKAIMVLGTGSGVGKSVIAAGFCRILSNWGYRVAPFKAQNMSNNSYVTEEGGEMGRAQVVQAECARVRPHTDMNPVLLKPAADNHSQVVVQGHAIGHFEAKKYYGQREVIARAIRESYERLASEYEVIVLEGAGSPAEMNLKKNDLVNMQMAAWADAACVLVGDIDKGGIFASLLGTLDLLTPEERQRIQGLIVNKFRGDLTLFNDGIDYIEKRGGKKIWGVLPYFHSIKLDEEDALPEKNTHALAASKNDLDIAVVLLPRMSNFTDFEVLKSEPGVRLRYVDRVEKLGSPDLLILPGTKATMADCRYLKESGFREKIQAYGDRGGSVLGICGGYQMMGSKLLDPDRVESEVAAMEGFGFINMTTRFGARKVLRRVSTYLDVQWLGCSIQGKVEAYEIHMGSTQLDGKNESDGILSPLYCFGNFAGTYYHGLFESAEFRESFLNALASRAGKQRVGDKNAVSAWTRKEEHFRLWADHLAQNLDLGLLKSCLNLPVAKEVCS
ncbi:MAG: cobyric acid synthase CobQ [Omnitrophica bacterium RIFOXYB12_FULL_50_7]|nr:MAG: cobyric acid synthase CobQ [Omnitrophica bacterium RIFOXYB12_FULL_50_7]